VRYNECDQLGMVFNANYLVYADLAVGGLWREHLGGYKSLNDAELDLVVAHADIEFRHPLRDDQMFEVLAEVRKIANTSMNTLMTIRTEERDCCVIDMTHVCVSSSTGKPVPIPDWVREGLAT
jgi:acyl-CoA thioester hydrolase